MSYLTDDYGNIIGWTSKPEINPYTGQAMPKKMSKFTAQLHTTPKPAMSGHQAVKNAIKNLNYRPVNHGLKMLKPAMIGTAAIGHKNYQQEAYGRAMVDQPSYGPTSRGEITTQSDSPLRNFFGKVMGTSQVQYANESYVKPLNRLGEAIGRKTAGLFFDSNEEPVQDMVIPSEGAAVREAERKQRQGMFGPNNYMDEDINLRNPYRY